MLRRVLQCSCIGNMLRLYERVGRPQFSQAWANGAMQEDSAHNIVYALVALQQRPVIRPFIYK